jgi:hypothetical protein
MLLQIEKTLLLFNSRPCVGVVFCSLAVLGDAFRLGSSVFLGLLLRSLDPFLLILLLGDPGASNARTQEFFAQLGLVFGLFDLRVSARFLARPALAFRDLTELRTVEPGCAILRCRDLTQSRRDLIQLLLRVIFLKYNRRALGGALADAADFGDPNIR